MSLRDLPGWLRDTALRMLPHRAPTGLVAIGNPGRDAPVLLTGNFTLTIRRLREALAGRDAWLLCADSKGINVWCAAGGGHLTHHDVITALRVSRVGERVDHRMVVLPQLCATGVERRVVEERTGWIVRWGPARLEDLPDFLDRRLHMRTSQRFMRFPLWERMEMAAMWFVPMLVVGLPAAAWLAGWREAVAVAALVCASVCGIFAALPRLRVTGPVRWLTYAIFACVGLAVAAVILVALSALTAGRLLGAGIAAIAAMGVLSVDLPGTTPWYASTINSGSNPMTVELVADRCTGAADCVQVCPRDVLEMDGRARKVRVARLEQCIACGACVVQCPEDALRFRYRDGSVVEAEVIRRTRMNMLGKRTVSVGEGVGR